jgi:hypothetical protein
MNHKSFDFMAFTLIGVLFLYSILYSTINYAEDSVLTKKIN